jgi:hypothetical protein
VSSGQLNTCLIAGHRFLQSPHDRSMGSWEAVLRLQVATEGGLEPSPYMTTGGNGSGGESCEGARVVEQRP